MRYIIIIMLIGLAFGFSQCHKACFICTSDEPYSYKEKDSAYIWRDSFDHLNVTEVKRTYYDFYYKVRNRGVCPGDPQYNTMVSEYPTDGGTIEVTYYDSDGSRLHCNYDNQ